jgi:ribonuclease-3
MGTGEKDISVLESRIAYTFVDKELLQRALTHPSFKTSKGTSTHNQRLEFLGDAVLGMVLAEALFTDFPDEREGVLTRYRSMLAKGQQLHALAQELELGEFLYLGEAEAAQGGRERASILEDALEAVIGAIYLDGGLDAASASVRHLYGSLSSRVESQLGLHNPKGKLQELYQPTLGNDSIEYRLIESKGPDHLKEFTVEVWIDGMCRGSGTGNSKKNAEEEAARAALDDKEAG